MTVVEVMQKIDANASHILYIVDKQGRLYGSVTDGDIRRWVLRSGSLKATATEFAFRDVKCIGEYNAKMAEAVCRAHNINSIPIIDNGRYIKDIYFASNCGGKGSGPCSSVLLNYGVVIMAGGKGTRLYPYTKVLPKPLLPIGDIPIIERIMNEFCKYGVQHFYLTVNYKKEMIQSYFAGMGRPYGITYIEETAPLGTAGGIGLIKEEFLSPVIITNCDILVRADYGKVMDFHIKSGNCMTIVSALKNMSIPYGVLHPKGCGIIASMEEKPQLSYFINTGMYIVDPGPLALIPKNRPFHMTQLAQALIDRGAQVGMYPVSESSFLDMGQFEEMKKMEEVIGREDAE